MEYRYVYYKVKDSIGRLDSKPESPHHKILSLLQVKLQERESFSRFLKLHALCLASLGGNSSIDVTKIQDKINSQIKTYNSFLHPYLDTESSNEETTQEDYSEYFKQINEEAERLKSEKEAQEKEKKDKEQEEEEFKPTYVQMTR